MHYPRIWYGELVQATSSQIVIWEGYGGRGSIYNGNFRYAYGEVVGGTLKGYKGGSNVTSASKYTLDSVVTGISLDAVTVYNLIENGQAETLQSWALAGNDSIKGSNYDDILYGYDGNDTLNGGYGADEMSGGLGDDIYIVDSDSDFINEEIGEGTDTIQSTVTYVLPSNVENLTLSGKSSIQATGNDLNNTLTGNSGNNILIGNAGNDTMIGGAGNDIYAVESTSDVIIDASGTDTILTNLSIYSLATIPKIENLVFLGTSNATLTGNALANTLTGFIYDDTLNGGLGKDTLEGGTGADTFVFYTALKSNIDTITDFSHLENDTIKLYKSVMSALSGDTFANDFKISTGAKGLGTITSFDSSDRIIYNQTTGALFYDADGSGKTKAVQIAIIGNRPTDIISDDFVIV